MNTFAGYTVLCLGGFYKRLLCGFQTVQMAMVPPGDTPRKKTQHAASSCLSKLLLCTTEDLKYQRLAGRSKAPEKWEALSQDGYITLTTKVASYCVIIKNYKEPTLCMQLT